MVRMVRTSRVEPDRNQPRKSFDKEKLQERLAKLAGGVAVIRVGAATETEMKEAKLRMEDALNATRAAVEEGVVSGGGSAYIHASKKVAELVKTLSGDEKIGAQIILKALEAPLFHIAYNAGLEGAVIINKVRESEVGTGFDAYKEEYVNMIDAGILDPAKVTRSALQNDGFVKKIAEYITKKVADKLAGMCKTDKEEYDKEFLLIVDAAESVAEKAKLLKQNAEIIERYNK